MFSKNFFLYFGAFSVIIFIYLIGSSPAKKPVHLSLTSPSSQGTEGGVFLAQESVNPLKISQLLVSQKMNLQAVSPINLFHFQSLASLFGPEAKKEIQKYVAKKGDSVWSIAKHFGISSQTVILANDLKTSRLKVGQELIILPVDGILYLVREGDRLEDIAKEYKVDPKKIAEFNNIEGDKLFLQELLIIPGGKMPSRVKSQKKTFARVSKSSPFRNYYPWGYCTWWVAHKRPIPRDWGNAISWLKNAKKDGFKVCQGSACPPKVGAVIALKTSHPLDHVAYVEQVRGDVVVFSEMNYYKFGQTDWRRLKVGNSSIRGYIYFK